MAKIKFSMRTKKVAVVNRTNLKNYGSVLQSFALCKVISLLGYRSEIVWETGNVSRNFDFRPRKIFSIGFTMLKHPSLIKSTLSSLHAVQAEPIAEEKVRCFDRFVDQNISRNLLTHKELVSAARSDEYYKFVCGSDQVWCSTTTYVDPLMYLRFAPRNKRVAYAPSIGRDYITSYNKRKMKKYIDDIPFVSIREDEGKRLINELLGRDVPVVADPTLLLEREFWSGLEANFDTGNRYILCYFLDSPSAETQRKLADYANKNSLRIVSIGCKLPELDTVEFPVCGPAEFCTG